MAIRLWKPAMFSSDRKQRIFPRADRRVDYGDLTETMDALRAAGYLKVAPVGLEGAAAMQ